jgi:hypothetical protein
MVENLRQSILGKFIILLNGLTQGERRLILKVLLNRFCPEVKLIIKKKGNKSENN